MTTINYSGWHFPFFIVPGFTEIISFKNSGKHDGKSGWAIFWFCFTIKHSAK